MDEAEQDQYEERLKEVFHSFDHSGSGSLCPQELSDLCQALHLQEAAPVLLHSLLNSQDGLIQKVDFEQFKDALILVLSTTIGEPLQIQMFPADSPEVNPKFVKAGKRYGRRSTPELADSVSGFSGVPEIQPLKEDLEEEEESSSVPRKRECHKIKHLISSLSAGQLHFWNPDEPGTPRGAAVPLSDRLEERLHEACEDLGLSLDGCANRHDLLNLCEHLCLEVKGDVFRGLDVDEVLNVQEFVSQVLRQSKPPTPSASTPYRQLKRHHSTQPFDETGRRTTTPSAMTSTISLRLFSSLDDGTGYTHAEYILDAWLEEGIANSPEILKALDFCLDGKVNLGELTMALENELLVTKNGIHQAVLASFKAEIRHLLERVDLEIREKEKLRSDLEKAEKLKMQLAAEVDEHHSAIERLNKLNIRKLEQDHKEKLAAVRAELTKEINIIQQQANQQREEFDIEIEKIKEEVAFLRERLTLSAKENCRLEAEVLDSTEKLVDAENIICKLQRNLDNIIKEKFGDLDIGSAEFFLQEERLRQLRTDYEEQCRELQDRIDELQTELEEYRSFNRAPHNFLKPSLSDEFDNKSPGIESDQGLGSEEIQPFNMSLEAEMLVENLKAQHLREMEEIRDQLESKVKAIDTVCSTLCLVFQTTVNCQEEVQSIQKMMSQVQDRVRELQNQLDQAEVLRVQLEESQAEDHKKLIRRHEEEVSSVKQELLQSQTYAEELKNQLKTLEDCQARIEQSLKEEREELLKLQREEQIQLEEHHKEELEEERRRLQEERQEEERRLTDKWEKEKSELQAIHEKLLQVRLEEQGQIQKEAMEQERRLSEQWENEKNQLLEQHKVLLEAEKLRFLQEQEEASLRSSLAQEKESLKQDLKREHNHLEKQHKEELEALMVLNQNLQNELERLVGNAQTKEIELSRQLNDLHNRFQENFDTKDQLLAQSEEKVQQMELLLRQAVEDFELEKAELQDSLTELEEKNKETLALAEKHVEEKKQLLAEMNYLKSKILEREAEVNQLSHFKESSERLSKENEEAYKTIALLQNQIKLIKTETETTAKSQQVNASYPLFQDVPETEICDGIASEDVRLISDLEYMQQGKDENNDNDIASVQEKVRQLEKEVELIPKFKKECELAIKERDLCIQEIIELQEKVACFRGQVCLFSEQKDRYDTTIEENVTLQEQISQLQNNELQLILKENKMSKNEPNQPKNFKDKASAMVETVKEIDFSEWQELQKRYEGCTCENYLLKEKNRKLEEKVLSLESKMLDVKGEHVKFEDEMVRMKTQNSKLTHQLQELQKQEDSFMILQQEADSPLTEAMSEETFQDLNIQLEAKIQAVSDLEECCTEFERQNAKLRRALTDLQMKSCKIHQKMQVHSMDEALQTISLQSARLKSDLRVTQQEKETLKQEMMSLHKQLQNVIDKNQVLEMALHTSGYQSQHKKLYWDEMARLVEQEQQLLRQDNERLQREVQNTKEDLIRSREKTRQLETTVLSLKQQRPLGQSSLVRAIEQEKVSLKRELDSLHKEMVTASKRVMSHLKFCCV
uniref:Ninein n=1 Tax=Scleropages formosus TaxID=113540 RepID=A0A8C9RDG5_SCLFO